MVSFFFLIIFLIKSSKKKLVLNKLLLLLFKILGLREGKLKNKLLSIRNLIVLKESENLDLVLKIVETADIEILNDDKEVLEKF